MKFNTRVLAIILMLLGLTSCDGLKNPIENFQQPVSTGANGATTTTVYQYIVPAFGNITNSGNYTLNNNANVTGWGDWVSIPVGENGPYVASSGDQVTFTILDSSGNNISGVQGTVFTNSSMGSLNVKADGKIYYAPSIDRGAITATTNCFSPLDWGAVIPTSSQPCSTATNNVCQNTGTSGSNSCTVDQTTTTCTPLAFPVLTATGNFGTPTNFPTQSSWVRELLQLPAYPLKVYGPDTTNTGAPGDFYIFFINGSTGSNSIVLTPGTTQSCGTDASACFTNDCATASAACSSITPGQTQSINCSQLSAICGTASVTGGGTSGASGDASCVKPAQTSNCNLVNGQGLDILTCNDLSGQNCKSIRSGQIMSPFISLDDYFGSNNTFAPVTAGQTQNVVPVPFDVMFANSLNNSPYLYPSDMNTQTKNQALSSNAASNYIKNFKSFSVLFGTNIAAANFDSGSNSFTGGQYLVFKIDPAVINPGGPAPTGGYNIGYFGYSPKDATNNGSTNPYASGDLVFTFADSNHIPQASNPARGTCSTTSANGICSFSQAPGATYTPQAGTTLYLRVADTIAPNNDVDGCYMDNYGYYVVNITVTSTQQDESHWFQKISGYVINFVVSTLKGAVSLFYSGIVTNPDFISVVRTMMTLYISMYAAYFVIGLAQVNATELLKRVIKISLLMILISPQSYTFYNEYLFGMLTQGFMQIVQYAMRSSGAAGSVLTPDQVIINVFGFVDDVINIFFAPSIWLRLLVISASFYTLFIIPMFIYAMFTYFKVIVEAFVGYLVMLTSIYLMIGLFPLFAIMLLFDYTRKYFWGWLNYTLNFCLQPIIFLISFMLLNSLIMIYLNTFINFQIEWGCWLQIFIDITSLVVAVAAYLPTLKVNIACIPWFILGSPIVVIINAFTLLLLIKSVKSMLDFAPIVAEKLMSSGFGADSGGVQVAPGAIPGMTGGGESGFGREASLAKEAYEGGRKGIKDLLYDKKVEDKMLQGSRDSQAVGGKIDLKRPGYVPASSRPGAPGAPGAAGVGGGGNASGSGAGLRPGSISGGSVGAASGRAAVAGSGSDAALLTGAARFSNLSGKLSGASGAAAQGSRPYTSSSYVPPSGKPLSTKDAAAQVMAQYQVGAGSAIRPIRDRGRDPAAERASVAAAVAGARGTGLGSAPVSGATVRQRGEATARPGSRGLPPAAGAATTPAIAQGSKMMSNPLHRGRSLEEFKAARAASGVAPVGSAAAVAGSVAAERRSADGVARANIGAPSSRSDVRSDAISAQAAERADSLIQRTLVIKSGDSRDEVELAKLGREYGSEVHSELTQIRQNHLAICNIAEADPGHVSSDDESPRSLAASYLAGSLTDQELSEHMQHAHDLSSQYQMIKEEVDRIGPIYDSVTGECYAPEHQDTIDRMFDLQRRSEAQSHAIHLVVSDKESRSKVRSIINQTMASGE